MMTQVESNNLHLQQQLEDEQDARAELARELDLIQEFIRTAGHDLMTPITTLKTSLYLLQRKPDLATPDRLSMMEGQLARLSNMVGAMGLMARLDGKTELNFDETDVVAIIHEALRIVNDGAKSKNVALYATVSDNLPEVALHFEEFKRALVNLLDNAIRYTAENGEVGVNVFEMHGYLCVDVQDTGIGLSDDEIQHLFERFYRGDDAGHAGDLGAGMGLPIVKRIVDLHGGKVRVSSEYGEGSTFRIMLPLD